MLYAIEIVPPLGLVAWSVTATEEMYQPFAPNVPARFNVVTGGELKDLEIRTMDDWAASRFPAMSVAAYSIVFCPLPLWRNVVVYGRHAMPSRRYCTPCTPLPTSVAVWVMLAEPTYDPSGAGVPRTWADVTGFDVSMFALTVRVASLFPAMSVA